MTSNRPKAGSSSKAPVQKRAGARRPLNRPAKRHIVRWNEYLNNKLLLAIQSACNTQGVKIPWSDVAVLMKHGITDGAIVQHLAKLRVKMIEAGQEVPPPLRRGGGVTASSSKTPPKSRKGSASYDSGDEMQYEWDTDNNEQESNDVDNGYGYAHKDQESTKRVANQRPSRQAKGKQAVQMPTFGSDVDGNEFAGIKQEPTPMDGDGDEEMGNESQNEYNSNEGNGDYVATNAGFLQYPRQKRSKIVILRIPSLRSQPMFGERDSSGHAIESDDAGAQFDEELGKYSEINDVGHNGQTQLNTFFNEMQPDQEQAYAQIFGQEGYHTQNHWQGTPMDRSNVLSPQMPTTTFDSANFFGQLPSTHSFNATSDEDLLQHENRVISDLAWMEQLNDPLSFGPYLDNQDVSGSQFTAFTDAADAMEQQYNFSNNFGE